MGDRGGLGAAPIGLLGFEQRPLHQASNQASAPAAPALSEDLELLGEYRGSGSTQAQRLLRRGDGTMLVISDLLYMVVSEIDGERDLDEIAGAVTRSLGRSISSTSVSFLIENKVRPLGILSGTTPARRSRPLLAIAARHRVIPQRLVYHASRALRPLFHPLVMVVVLVAMSITEVWLWAENSFHLAVRDVLARPADLLLILAITLAASAFHELGHATASHYGGASPGAIGVGVYLVWPAFYTDMTDCYRLNRAGRLRADLGGVYFNLIVVLLLSALYGSTGNTALLAAIVFQHLVVLQQFIPFLRLDGYFVVSDLTGVPDLFGQMRAVLAGLLPWRKNRSMSLKRGVRFALTLWAIATVVVVGAAAVLLCRNLPSYALTAGKVLRHDGSVLAGSLRSGEIASAILALTRLMLLGIQKFGLGLIAGRMAGRLVSLPLRTKSLRLQGAP